jgi:hypothetical protein
MAVDGISESLQDALYDCDWLPGEVFEKDAAVSGRELVLRREAYQALILPAVEAIPHPTLAKAKEFFDRGGVVAAYGRLPTNSATEGKTAADIAALREAIWGAAAPGLAACRTNAAGGRSYFLPEAPTPEDLRQVLDGDAGIHPALEVLEGEGGHWLHVLHRVKADRDVFFIANQNITGGVRRFRFRIAAEGFPECWDAMRNEITAVPFERKGPHVELSLTMEPNESALLVFAPEKRPRPVRVESKDGGRSIAIVRRPTPVTETPELDTTPSFEGGAWTWYPEGDPARDAPAATRYFRKRIALPDAAAVRRAVFEGTADNRLLLFVNGREAGRSSGGNEEWRKPVTLDVTKLLLAGVNQLAISATNAAANVSANPAGVLGRLTVEFDRGEPLVVRVDKAWKASREGPAGWADAGFDDHAWVSAREVASFGAAPWGRLDSGPITRSPAKADPFLGQCEIPADLDLAHARVCLEMTELSPEEAARVTVNGAYAGGFLSKPLRLDVTKHLKAGQNEILIEPFAPKSARLVIRE